MAFWNLFGNKVSANKELLQKEMNDLQSLDTYSQEFKKELEKLKPFLEGLKKKTSKGKNLSSGDVEILQNYDGLVAESLAKYSEFKQTILTESTHTNLKNDGYFRNVLAQIESITNGRNKIVGLSLIHDGAVSESMVKIGTALTFVDENIVSLNMMSKDLKNVETEVKTDLGKAV